MKAAAAMLMFVTMGMGCASQAPAERTATGEPSAEEMAATAAAQGAISPEKLEEIDQFFHRKMGQVQYRCYSQETERTGKKAEGMLCLALTVQPGGKASEVRVTHSSLKSPGIERCVLDEMKAWEWPEVPSPAPYTGSINFKPAW
jgi:hypothetical protein